MYAINVITQAGYKISFCFLVIGPELPKPWYLYPIFLLQSSFKAFRALLTSKFLLAYFITFINQLLNNSHFNIYFSFTTEAFKHHCISTLANPSPCGTYHWPSGAFRAPSIGGSSSPASFSIEPISASAGAPLVMFSAPAVA